MTDEPVVMSGVVEEMEVEEEHPAAKKIYRLAGWATAIGWGLLVFYLVLAGLDLWQTIQGVSQVGFSQENLGNIMLSLLSPISRLLTGAFYFIILQSAAEGLYLMLDIWDTRG